MTRKWISPKLNVHHIRKANENVLWNGPQVIKPVKSEEIRPTIMIVDRQYTPQSLATLDGEIGIQKLG